MNNQTEEPDAEEEVFVDAVTSPDPESAPPQGLRRSTRKRKSVTDSGELETATRTKKTTGKRPRPFAEMHRTPDQAGKVPSKSKSSAKRPPASDASPDLRQQTGFTMETDPPTETQSREQILLMGGIRAVLREELNKTEDKLTKRLESVEKGFSNLRGDVRTLEELSLIHI